MANKRKKPATDANRSWIVRMKCVVIKDVIVDDCTEDEALNNPWQYAVDEIEVEQPDWEVQSVKPNEQAGEGEVSHDTEHDWQETWPWNGGSYECSRCDAYRGRYGDTRWWPDVPCAPVSPRSMPSTQLLESVK